MSPSSALSPTVRSSRNSGAGSIRSRRKTSVDQRYEAEAELNNIEAEILSPGRISKSVKKQAAPR